MSLWFRDDEIISKKMDCGSEYFYIPMLHTYIIKDHLTDRIDTFIVEDEGRDLKKPAFDKFVGFRAMVEEYLREEKGC